ncbi:MAG: ABC transporter permease [Oscillospiraceae bacterium]|jgi:putative ABC transport system permease protein|nr:ABC transporter permease [Oscillospiraceae bacterium]
MYVFEHALLNLVKNKGRNILFGMMLFAVITSSVIALSIFNASDAIIANARVEFNSMVQIRPQSRQIGGNANASQTVPLPEDWIVFRDEAAYRRMIAPIENLQDVSFTFLLVVLIFGAAVMTLLSIIAIRERKYEIGVLRAMGMKKKKIALGLWFETILITCICFIFGVITGTALATPVSNMLWSGDGQISITLNAITTVQILGVSLLLATIAGTVSVSRITKYEPIKILMERN